MSVASFLPVWNEMSDADDEAVTYFGEKREQPDFAFLPEHFYSQIHMSMSLIFLLFILMTELQVTHPCSSTRITHSYLEEISCFSAFHPSSTALHCSSKSLDLAPMRWMWRLRPPDPYRDCKMAPNWGFTQPSLLHISNLSRLRPLLKQAGIAQQHFSSMSNAFRGHCVRLYTLHLLFRPDLK